MGRSIFDSIYGLNRRNRELVRRLNTARDIALANDKVASKRLLQAQGVPVAKEVAVIHYPHAVEGVLAGLEDRAHGVVVKPSQGTQGRGVNIFMEVRDDGLVRADGSVMSLQDFRFLVATITSGEYTYGRPSDCALLEDRLRPSRSWILPGLPGAPDLRIVVHKGVPILAMARLPTLASEGRANLHQGGVGLGVDLRTQKSTYGIWKDRSIERHPDTGDEVTGRDVEGLADCVRMAADCAKAIPLGYMGVDLMLDERRGPCVIEVNARPGLAIQIANRIGLGSVLEHAS
ncbi:MAG: ATP-grasp domain-containing protein [Candidatus Hydrogenedentes bacterium]|nr:ATP-grasp domain-containing protein [Candidatus Hydrogenedentota bacterium]